MPTPCSVPDCERSVLARGYCPRHYQRWRKNGSPTAGRGDRSPHFGIAACLVPDCERKPYGFGYCAKHYRRFKRHGDPRKLVRAPGGAGTISRDGYRRIERHDNGRRRAVLAHRAVWEAAHGPLPPGFIIHHINENRLDNRIENLAAMSRADHQKLHAKIRRLTGRTYKPRKSP